MRLFPADPSEGSLTTAASFKRKPNDERLRTRVRYHRLPSVLEGKASDSNAPQHEG
ncbi:hypothetical protein SAMN04488583_0445 [Mycobacterium sp. 88mf]|nr:hypothetical protein SAMN04488583_0445 [Mycobacterium sp. 88mf]SFF04537.1 hypothetical protein SAMN04488582_10120 [Mycobacterium sp. 455mf]